MQKLTRYLVSDLSACLLLLLVGSAAPAYGQDAPPDGFSFRGELTTVFTRGNTEALTFGLGAAVENRRGPNLLKMEAGGMRTESVIVTRRAVGTAESFSVDTDEDREKTAEAYFARARYD